MTWHGWRNYTAAWGHPFRRNHARNPEPGGLRLNPTIRRADRWTPLHYFSVGDLSEAVRAYAERNDLLEVQRIQTALVQTVQEDFAGPLDRFLAQAFGSRLEPDSILPAAGQDVP